MTDFGFDDASVPVREDIPAAHRRMWAAVAAPGTWLDGPTRIAVVAEARNAWNCALCRARNDALSPNAVSGTHDHLGDLPDAIVEVVHRVITDPGRLSQSWYRDQLAAGLSEGEYVETVGVAATTLAMDRCADVLGANRWALPEPVAGEPGRHRPLGAKQGPAWVPWTLPEDVTESEAGLYDHGDSNVCKALSLVPAAVGEFFDVILAQYLPDTRAMRNFAQEFRSITHAQIELLAARVSAINQCAY